MNAYSVWTSQEKDRESGKKYQAETFGAYYHHLTIINIRSKKKRKEKRTRSAIPHIHSRQIVVKKGWKMLSVSDADNILLRQTSRPLESWWSLSSTPDSLQTRNSNTPYSPVIKCLRDILTLTFYWMDGGQTIFSARMTKQMKSESVCVCCNICSVFTGHDTFAEWRLCLTSN